MDCKVLPAQAATLLPLSVSAVGLSSGEAQALVFDTKHWRVLNALVARRYPDNDNLADEALMYVLDKLEEDHWKRVRGWRGCSSFSTYLCGLASRLITDFGRLRFGYSRKPKRLAALAKADPLWAAGYQHVVVDGLSRTEAAERLRDLYPARRHDEVDMVVSGVLALAMGRPRYGESSVTLNKLDGDAGIAGSTPDPDRDAAAEVLTLLAAKLLDDSVIVHPCDACIDLESLLARIGLDEHDTTFLRLRFCEGLSIKDIAARLELTDNPFKRYHNLLTKIRAVLLSYGLDGTSLRQ
jgi:DNA-directed RNA polymerase specialized sigma24 family protein